MKYFDGTDIEEVDIVSIFPRRIEMGANYEIWQHPYFKINVLAENFDLQLIYFIDKKMSSHTILHRMRNAFLMYIICPGSYRRKTITMQNNLIEKKNHFLQRNSL